MKGEEKLVEVMKDSELFGWYNMDTEQHIVAWHWGRKTWSSPICGARGVPSHNSETFRPGLTLCNKCDNILGDRQAHIDSIKRYSNYDLLDEALASPWHDPQYSDAKWEWIYWEHEETVKELWHRLNEWVEEGGNEG